MYEWNNLYHWNTVLNKKLIEEYNDEETWKAKVDVNIALVVEVILIASLIEISNDLLARAEISQVIWYHYDDVVDVIALWIPQDVVVPLIVQINIIAVLCEKRV